MNEMRKILLKEILKEAMLTLYFNDNSDYETALWKIVEIAGGKEAADLLESNPEAAYKKYCTTKKEKA